ncbi:Tyrosine recombinase XerC [Zhongshania aliphaticivorans]|uniref:Tyrosine recombinase XerC n=1 Tax=Zhongshania aliphaticivorans TaxID=1470434 RepID=A0A5S9N5Z2_9GAMM|nr:tyrosine-type recombinase/integrase [Zhongshania aliphaticivorans]CAA0081188.1 Tyrosine recombinase XerC [Zhongshania aliphaticivorans]CAA0085208.1 Tyrosine recombinase XerC [Zhongshania aliphaticivorans]
MPKKTEKGWLVDMRPDGRDGRRVRRTFETKAEALRFKAFTKAQADKGEWNPTPADTRRLSELCQLWFDHHGNHLTDGVRRLSILNLITSAMNNPIASQIKPDHYLRYRAKKEAQPKTHNNELGYLNSVFNELHRLNHIDYPNPLAAVKPIKLSENELAFLTGQQITELLDSIRAKSDNKHVLLITKICLSTGCRWGEAESLHRRQLQSGKLTFTDTKSKRNRSVPISAELEREIIAHGKGQLFSSSLTSFRRALARTTIELPKGQAAHVLRHTFASHFMMNGGDIISLQRILGHASITMTMRYAHLSPSHLAEAVKLNPLTTPAA